jgi:Kdo2-lipid IVA lauroyltransferase/acyltransferase
LERRVADRAAWKRAATRYVVRPVETVLLYVLHAILSALPIDTASALGGAIARSIGPRLGLTRRARKNLGRAFPELDPAAIERLVREMWDNLGRVAAELPHLPRMKVFDNDPVADVPRVEVIGREHLDNALARGKPIIFFTAHIGNWEVAPLASLRCGLPLHVVYRSANNRWADRLFLAGRRDVVGGMIPKGAEGARRMLKAVQDGKPLGMLVDQKMNDGIAVPFFGREAMTAPALAQLALRYGCTVLPGWVERLEGAHFRATVEPPLPVPSTGDRHADILTLMTTVNARIEAWIRQRPGQWLWLHKRWPD